MKAQKKSLAGKKIVNQAPGPKGNLITGSLTEMAKDPITLLSKSEKIYGNTVRFRFLNTTAFLITHPDDIKYVLSENHQNYRKAFTYDKLKPLLGNGLLTSSGELWKKQRKIIQPMFRQGQIPSFINVMLDFTNQALAELSEKEGSKINISAEMMKLTLNIAIKALLTADISRESTEVREAFTFVLEYINYRMTDILAMPQFIPTRANLKYKRSMNILEEMVGRIIKNRHGKEHEYKDLLSMMLSSAKENKSMNDRQVRDEIMTFILAGHETTAHTLSWTLHLLSVHPEIKQYVKKEVDRVLNGKELAFEDLGELKYLNMVIQEAMRLYPPLWIIERENNEADKIGGYTIPKDSLIMISPYVTHRLPEIWQEPEKFNPERFLPEEKEKRSKFAFIPFGAGPRQCIGNHFAMTEALVVLSKILQKFDFEPVSEEPPQLESVITLRPKNGIMIQLRSATDKPVH